MTYPYRCCACRARNTSRRAVNNWLPVRGQLEQMSEAEINRRVKDEGGMRCKSCGHTSFYTDKYRMLRPSCDCGGYHFKHRPGSPYCDKHPRVDMNRAKRAGATDAQLDDLQLDLSMHGIGGTTHAPGEAVPF